MSASIATVQLLGEESTMENVLVVGESADGVRITGGGGRLIKCTVSGAGGDGVRVDQFGEDSWITDCDIEDAQGHGVLVQGTGATSTRRVHITGNTIVNCSSGGSGVSDGIHIANPSTGTSLANVITGNIIHGTTATHRDGVRLAGANVTSNVVCSNVSVGHSGSEFTDSGTDTRSCAGGAHTHDGSGGGGGSIDHDDLTNVTSDQHHAEAHTIASHSDTTATGAELEELTDGSVTSLHSHSGGGSSPLTTKGDVWGYDTADNRIPVGTNDQVLTADSTTALGVAWKTPASGSGGLDLTTKGDLHTYDTDDAALSVGADDEILVADSGETTGLDWKTMAVALEALLTTKGDVAVNNGTTVIRLPVGSNDQVLTADSGETAGLKWAAATGGSGGGGDPGAGTQIAGHIDLSSDTSLTTVTWTDLPFDTSQLDVGGFVDLTEPGFVVPTGGAGVYGFSSVVIKDANDTDARSRLTVNGTEHIMFQALDKSDYTADDVLTGATTVIELDDGDAVRLQYFFASSGNLRGTTSSTSLRRCAFVGWRISGAQPNPLPNILMLGGMT